MTIRELYDLAEYRGYLDKPIKILKCEYQYNGETEPLLERESLLIDDIIFNDAEEILDIEVNV